LMRIKKEKVKDNCIRFVFKGFTNKNDKAGFLIILENAISSIGKKWK